MKKVKLFLIVIAWAVFGLALTAWAQTGYRVEGKRVETSSREADFSVVRVYGPRALTELAQQAIQEKRPDVAVETYHEPLRNKVRIEGTTGTGYMPLSPKRVERMRAARAKGGSVYEALCSQQRGVIQKTVGEASDWVRIERREYRTERRICYVRPICPPPPPIVLVPPVNVGVAIGRPYSWHGYPAYGTWVGRGDHGYRAMGAHPFPHPVHHGHLPVGPIYRGHR